MMARRLTTGVVAFALACFSVCAQASDDAACQNAWGQSAASSSCYGGQNSSTSAYVEWRSARQECIVTAYFLATSAAGQSWNYNQTYGTVSEVRELHNCSGTLQEGSC